MHELSLCYSLVELAEAECNKHKANKVTDVYVEVGALSGVEIGPLEFAFPEAIKGTIVENAKLHVQFVPLEIACQQCHKNCSPEPIHIICLHCGCKHVDIIKGRDFKLNKLELEELQNDKTSD